MTKLVPLADWAATRYSPPPSDWVLRKWARAGEIYPPPERVGRDWYVDETARRLTQHRDSVVDRIKRERSATNHQQA